MRSAKSVISECYIDSCLFNVLLNFEKESVNHAKGNATVLRKMELDFTGKFCVGIIDQDKREPPQVKAGFNLIEIRDIQGSFKLFKHKTETAHYLIQIVPVVETWIWNTMLDLNIQLDTFEIDAGSIEELTFITKKVDKKEDPKFKALFKGIINKSIENEYLPVVKLQKIINLILDSQYKLDINELKNV